jgi:hypothetical protein
MCLARMVDQWIPLDEPIDLINVAFENPRVQNHAKRGRAAKANEPTRDIYQVPDRVTGREGLAELW